jgi:hypothetical protein
MIDPAGIYSHGISLLLVLGVMNPITYSDTADTHSVAERDSFHSVRRHLPRESYHLGRG